MQTTRAMLSLVCGKEIKQQHFLHAGPQSRASLSHLLKMTKTEQAVPQLCPRHQRASHMETHMVICQHQQEQATRLLVGRLKMISNIKQFGNKAEFPTEQVKTQTIWQTESERNMQLFHQVQHIIIE